MELGDTLRVIVWGQGSPTVIRFNDFRFGFAVLLDVRGCRGRGRARIRTLTRHRVDIIRGSWFRGYLFCKDRDRAGSALRVGFKGRVCSLIGSML
jgi:hypothetical protein